MKKLVMDIDGVIANFVDGFLARAEDLGGYEGMPCCWKGVQEYQFFPSELFRLVGTDESFWLGLRRMPGVRQAMVHGGLFPDMYLTARPIRSEISVRWLNDNLFPVATVVTVNQAEGKLKYLEPGDVFVDDLPSTVRAAQEKGVTALLMQAPFHAGCTEEELEGLTVIYDLSEVSRYLD